MQSISMINAYMNCINLGQKSATNLLALTSTEKINMTIYFENLIVGLYDFYVF